jgi:HJR/Mrr/RecB family endonuclease
MIAFTPTEAYSHEEIYRSLGVGNAGGIRFSIAQNGSIQRVVLLTSLPTARIRGENPYHDRVEGDVLVYTGAGQEGDQALGGRNKRLLDQAADLFPIYGFQLLSNRRSKEVGPKRWRFLGLLSYLRHYKEFQIDIRGISREVWVFEFRIHSAFERVSPDFDFQLTADLIAEEERSHPLNADDRVLVRSASMAEPDSVQPDPVEMERIRSQMLALPADRFEHLIKDVLVDSGFKDVHVTRYSQDGGIDVNAFAGQAMWPLRDLLVQIQAKRWLHTVGRKEVAELRGSLQPHARGAVVTTSQFSRAAMIEASETGKQPIVLVDGFQFARVVSSCGIALP